MKTPWAGMDPNSAGQLWSRWEFSIFDNGRHPPFLAVKENVARWIRKGFGSVGKIRVTERIHSWCIVLDIEGVPANDPEYVASVQLQFQRYFVEKGWGPLAVGVVEVRILAGDRQNGKPREQLLVVPMITSEVEI